MPTSQIRLRLHGLNRAFRDYKRLTHVDDAESARLNAFSALPLLREGLAQAPQLERICHLVARLQPVTAREVWEALPEHQRGDGPTAIPTQLRTLTKAPYRLLDRQAHLNGHDGRVYRYQLSPLGSLVCEVATFAESPAPSGPFIPESTAWYMVQVLRGAGHPMHHAELTRRIQSSRLVNGRTVTKYLSLYRGVFLQVGRGIYDLRERHADA